MIGNRSSHSTEEPSSSREGKSVGELLATFAKFRRENIAALVDMNLTSADLSRTGQHLALGERLEQLLATRVVHDLDHVEQIARTMAKVYTYAVGPWSAYLSILQDRGRPRQYHFKVSSSPLRNFPGVH